MATDIYLSKAIHEQYEITFWHDCPLGIGGIQLTHLPCDKSILDDDRDDNNQYTHWDYMEAMSKHARECEAGRSMRAKPSPGLVIDESEIRRG